MDADEAALLERARGGDGRAFEELLTPHRAKLWSICWRITGNQYDAEDALQEALTAAWLHLGSFRSDARFSTWAYRIASNAALAVVRKRRDIPVDDFPDLGEPSGVDFAEVIADRDRIQTALAGIPEQFREALVLREYGTLTYEQIAEHQGIPVQTVKSRLSRARAAVAAALSDTSAEPDRMLP